MDKQQELADEAIYIGGDYHKALIHMKAESKNSSGGKKDLKTIVEESLEMNPRFLKWFGKARHTKGSGN